MSRIVSFGATKGRVFAMSYLLLGILTLAACGKSGDSVQPAADVVLRDVPHVMPTFQLQVWSIDSLDDALGDPAGIAVTSGGTIAMLDPDGADEAVVLLIDAATGSHRRAIRQGRGPGELSGIGQVFATGDQLLFLDFAKMKLLGVDTAGDVLSEHDAPLMDAILVVAGADSLDVIPAERPGNAGVFRRARSGGERQLVSPDEPFFASMRDVPDRRSLPAFASREGWFVVGDGMRYKLAMYDVEGRAILKFGRDIPARKPTEREVERRAETLSGGGPGKVSRDHSAELARFRDTPLAHFAHPAVWIDNVGRVRVVGTTGDSAFVDVFADSAHLGRVVLACTDFNRRIAQADQWLVLMCADPVSGGNLLRVWEVTD